LILLTNDDGYDSPGLQAAAGALTDLGDLWIVAPQSQQSGMGRAWLPNATRAIHRREVQIDGRPHPAFAVDGSPSQAVAHALLEVLPGIPDLVVSGINFGENLGPVVTVSGTVGAALEAAVSGIPSLAVSLEMDPTMYHSNSDKVDFATAGYFVRYFAERVMAVDFPADVHLLKIEVPNDASPATPWQVTRLSQQRYFVVRGVEREKLEGPAMLNYAVDREAGSPGSDTHTLASLRRVSVTPLSFDLTSRTSLKELSILLGDGHDSGTTRL
jgi:5'-nucleotidase